MSHATHLLLDVLAAIGTAAVVVALSGFGLLMLSLARKGPRP